MSSPYAQPSGKVLNPQQPLNPTVVPAPASVQVNQPGKVIPNPSPANSPYTTAPTTESAPSAPKLYQPTGSSPYTTEPTTPAPAPSTPPPVAKLYEPTGPSPYTTEPSAPLTATGSITENMENLPPPPSSTIGIVENDLTKIGGDIVSVFFPKNNVVKGISLAAPIVISKVTSSIVANVQSVPTRKDILGITVPKPKITVEKAETAGMVASYGLGPEVGVPVTALVTGGLTMVGIQAVINRVLGNPGSVARKDIFGLNITVTKSLTPQQAYQSFALGSIFTGVSSVALKGVALATGGAESIFAKTGIQSVLARSAFAGAFGGGVGYAFTRNPVVALEGAALSAGMVGVSDFLGGGAKTELTKPSITASSPTEVADVTQITGGKSTGLLTEEYSSEGDLRELSRQTEIATKTTTIKDPSYLAWLKDFNANFQPEQVEMEGQGTKYYLAGDTMETVKGASAIRVPAEPFIESVGDTEIIQRAEGVNKGFTLIAGKAQVSETMAEEGSFLTPDERETYNLLGVDRKVMLQNDIYNSARVQGTMSPEMYAELQARLLGNYIQPDVVPSEEQPPMKPFDYESPPFKEKPFFSSMGGLSHQQLMDLETTNPSIKEIPVSTDILNVNIRDILGETQYAPARYMPALIFTGLLSVPTALTRTITKPKQILSTPEKTAELIGTRTDLGTDTDIITRLDQTYATLFPTPTKTLTDQTTKQTYQEPEIVMPFSNTENKFSPFMPGFTYGLNSGFDFAPPHHGRARSVKRAYPVQTPEQLLGLPPRTFKPKRR